MIKRQVRVLIFLSGLGLFSIAWMYTLLASNDSFFSSPKEEYEISLDEKLYDEYEKMREEKNRKRMLENYNELLKRGKKVSFCHCKKRKAKKETVSC